MIDYDAPMIDFSAEERCDRCAARAYTLAQHPEHGELMFCMHHSKEFRQGLFDDGWEIIDDTLGLEEIGCKVPELV